MSRTFGLGTPTEYGFILPRRRYELARRYLPRPGALILDFGCGNGANTVLFRNDAARVVGVDMSWEHLSDAVAYRREHALFDVSYLLCGDRLPFADRTFDHAVSFEVLEHTVDDAAALVELRRVMKPGAVLTLSVPNKWYLMETHGFDLPPRRLPWNRVPLLSWLPTRVHERYAGARIYTKRRITRLLARTGFEPLEHRYIMPPFDRVNRPGSRKALRLAFAVIERTPLRVVGVAHFIAARRLATDPA